MSAIAVYTWTMIRSDGSRIRLVLAEGTLIRLDRDSNREWLVRWGYSAHRDTAHERALKETASLEAWGHVLRMGSLRGRWIDLDPLELYWDSESGSKVGPIMQELLAGPWEEL